MKTIKLGIFGAGRGRAFIESTMLNNGKIVALCDMNEKRVGTFMELLPKGVEQPVHYTNFDDFLEHDMDAVVLCNFFPEHAPYAVRCLEKGLHVLSECTSNGTMAEGVALVRAAEKSKAIYMLAENYPFGKSAQELTRLNRSGVLGKTIYAEGEYAHPANYDEWPFAAPDHWRNYVPATYYLTHALAPLMYATGAFPTRVTALPACIPFDEFEHNSCMNADRMALISCLNNDNSLFRVTGWAKMTGQMSSYRICGTKGSAESLRTCDGKVSVHYNEWSTPEGQEKHQIYTSQLSEDVRSFLRDDGHDGGDFFVVREFFDSIRSNTRPLMDEYFATTCASVGILAHRSLMEKGVPYDIPDFHKEEDRKKYENDNIMPMPTYGNEPNFPCCSVPDYRPPEEKYQRYLETLRTRKK